MGKYTINDFKIGDDVYHVSNQKLIMSVIDVNKNKCEVTCSFVDSNGLYQTRNHLPSELGKKGKPTIRILTLESGL